MFAVPIVNLKVPKSWPVGRIVLRQPDWLVETVERSRLTRSEKLGALLDRLADDARQLQWALAVVEASDYEEARPLIEETIAVLRLYQRFRYRYVSLDRQTFGLPDTVTRHLEEYFAIDSDGGIGGTGFVQSGVLGSWEFSEADVDAWLSDPAFRCLDDALRKGITLRTEPEKRLLTALGILALSTASLRPVLRHVLLAVALEALLGDAEMHGRAHRVAARAAFLTCDTLGVSAQGPHGAARPACPVIAYRYEKEMSTKITGMGLAGRMCSYYSNVRDMFTRRNQVLHEGLDIGNMGKPETGEWWGDHVFIQFARFVMSTAPRASADLDVEMARVVAANPQLADATIGKP